MTKIPTFELPGGTGDFLHIENPLAGVLTAVPLEVKVDDRYIHWRRDSSDEGMHGNRLGFLQGGSAHDAIWQFLELVDAEPAAFRSFAERYGVLGIRNDGLPSTASPVPEHVNTYPFAYMDDGERWFREEIATWRMYAVGLRTIIVTALALRETEYPDPAEIAQDFGLGKYTWEWFGMDMATQAGSEEERISEIYIRWLTFLDPQQALRTLSPATDHQAPPEKLTSFVNGTWLRYSGLVPHLRWEGGHTVMTLELGDAGNSGYPSNMAFSILVAQLASLLSSEPFERLDHCSVCGRLFVPAIKPGRHDRAYCPEHKLEGERDRKRRWARKQAAAKKLASR